MAFVLDQKYNKKLLGSTNVIWNFRFNSRNGKMLKIFKDLKIEILRLLKNIKVLLFKNSHLIISDNFDFSMLKHTNTWVGGSEIDSNSGGFRHFEFDLLVTLENA